jgi:hypothetical protein
MITDKDKRLIERFVDYKLGDANVFGKKNIQRLITRSNDQEFINHLQLSLEVDKASAEEDILDLRKKILAEQKSKKMNG